MDDLDDPWVEAEVFDRAAAGNHQRVVVFRLNLVEGGIESEIVPALLCVRLIAFEVMDAGRHEVACLLTWANGVNGMADHLQRLKGDHYFVVFDVIANEHENGFLGHVPSNEIVTEEYERPLRGRKSNARRARNI